MNNKAEDKYKYKIMMNIFFLLELVQTINGGGLCLCLGINTGE